jgi:hypothetical protein
MNQSTGEASLTQAFLKLPHDLSVEQLSFEHSSLEPSSALEISAQKISAQPLLVQSSLLSNQSMNNQSMSNQSVHNGVIPSDVTPITTTVLAEQPTANAPFDLTTQLSQQVIRQQLIRQQLGLKTKAGFEPVPVSLTPWKLSKAQFAKAQHLATLLGHVQASAAANPEWLLALLAKLEFSQSVPGQIWRTLRNIYPAGTESTSSTQLVVNRNLMLNRHDFMLDQQQQWQWVESNPIAAGMGPLNAQYLALIAQYRPGSYAANDAVRVQATLLADAAIAQSRTHQSTTHKSTTHRAPLMLIVVEGDEDNIFDQRLLCDEVQRLGVRVERVTISELMQSELSGNNQLLWQTQPVDLLYWRTGYNPSAELNDDYWHFRARLESTAVSQCPTLLGQLTGSKWFQHQFSKALLHDSTTVAAKFAIAPDEVNLLKQAVVQSFGVSELSAARIKELITAGYWYKTQQEGGGNVARGQAALDKSNQADHADILMAPINAAIRQEAFTSLRQNNTTVTTEHISELGIFSLGDTADYGGYLCRTKPALNNEGGVHRGGAVLDVIEFID